MARKRVPQSKTGPILIEAGGLFLGLLIGALIVPGIGFSGLGALLMAVLVMGLLNLFLRPVLLLFALPFIILTMGLGIIVINAVLFVLAASLVPGFSVASFWSALAGAIVAGIVLLFYRSFFPEAYRRAMVEFNVSGRTTRRVNRRPDDVIDI